MKNTSTLWLELHRQLQQAEQSIQHRSCLDRLMAMHEAIGDGFTCRAMEPEWLLEEGEDEEY